MSTIKFLKDIIILRYGHLADEGDVIHLEMPILYVHAIK